MATGTYPVEQSTDRSWALHLLILLAVLLGWRLLTLHFAGIDLYFDEAQYWVWSQEPAFGYFSKPPMIAWLIGSTTTLCGQAESCVRLGAPLLHTGTAILLYCAGAKLFDRPIGFWSAIVFVTVPGIAFSSALISTDVPLLFFWSGALLALIHLQEKRSWLAANLLGICIGLGLLSKYAMVYFLLCAGIWMLVERDARWLLRDPRLAAVLILPLILIAPNLVWNLQNGLATFSHTADNANWGGNLLHPLRALEFFGAQFGVFGPILFGSLIFIAIRSARQADGAKQKMLLAFSLPVLLLILVQALLSRAHPNWAATAYPAAAILVTEALIRKGWRRLFTLSLALHLAVQIALTIGLMAAPTLALPGRTDPFWRALGWSETAETVHQHYEAGDYRAILTDNRYMTAELLYYLRDARIPVFAFTEGGKPQDHFALSRPYGKNAPAPVLLASESAEHPAIFERFDSVSAAGSFTINAGARRKRTVHLFRLDGYRGEAHE